MAQERIINFDDPRERGRVAAGVQKLRGRWRLSFTRYRPRRSDWQNRYYHPCFCEPYAAYLSDQTGEPVSREQAHEDLKRRFLRKPLIDKNTGVLLGETTGSSAALNTAEFNEYLDQCAAFLATECNIIVPEPDEYHEREMKHAFDLRS